MITDSGISASIVAKKYFCCQVLTAMNLKEIEGGKQKRESVN